MSISIHASYAGRDFIKDQHPDVKFISIHASYAGRDVPIYLTLLYNFEFQSTRPMRDATSLWCYSRQTLNFNPRVLCGTRRVGYMRLVSYLYFNPRVLCGTRPAKQNQQLYLLISIHASYAGRDIDSDKPYSCYLEFQSTRPMRDATFSPISIICNHQISIHASYAGRDLLFPQILAISSLFQSTRPMRDATKPVLIIQWISTNFNPRVLCGTRRKSL